MLASTIHVPILLHPWDIWQHVAVTANQTVFVSCETKWQLQAPVIVLDD